MVRLSRFTNFNGKTRKSDLKAKHVGGDARSMSHRLICWMQITILTGHWQSCPCTKILWGEVS